jgi:hypothetical protein
MGATYCVDEQVEVEGTDIDPFCTHLPTFILIWIVQNGGCLTSTEEGFAESFTGGGPSDDEATGGSTTGGGVTGGGGLGVGGTSAGIPPAGETGAVAPLAAPSGMKPPSSIGQNSRLLDPKWGDPSTWRTVDGPRWTKWVPTAPSGNKPQILWDPHDRHFSLDDGRAAFASILTDTAGVFLRAIDLPHGCRSWRGSCLPFPS